MLDEFGGNYDGACVAATMVGGIGFEASIGPGIYRQMVVCILELLLDSFGHIEPCGIFSALLGWRGTVQNVFSLEVTLDDFIHKIVVEITFGAD